MRVKFLAVTGLLLMSPVYAALALPITSVNQLVVFGDSLSDAGNASIATLGAFPGPNYATRNVPGVPFPVGYFTDGPNTNPDTASPSGLWIDQFAAKAGLADPQPFLAPLPDTNLAVASAQTGSANPQDVSNQVLAFDATHPTGLPSNALYTIWAGSNDILNGNTSLQAVNKAADSLYQNILSLAAGGAKYFLWIDLAPLGDTPMARAAGAQTSAALNAASVAFNAEWATDIAKLQGQGIAVVGVDVYTLFNQITSAPGSYGFNDVTDSAQGMNANPNSFLFWDGEHPTTAGDALVANLAFNDLVATPEPMSIGLALIGLFGLIATRKLRRRDQFS